jgi:hypothetical protein
MKTLVDLTDLFPMKFDVERMQAELSALESLKWIDHYDRKISNGWASLLLSSRDGTTDQRASMKPGTYGRFQRTPLVDRLPYFRAILDAFQCPIGRVRISKMLPHTFIGAHRDIGREAAGLAFGQVRLHLPIVTNDQVRFVVGGKVFRLFAGRLYYLDFTKLHSVYNDGDGDRIHLILELRVNDFLRRMFPDPTPRERLELLTARYTMPLIWPILKVHFGVKQLFARVPPPVEVCAKS